MDEALAFVSALTLVLGVIFAVDWAGDRSGSAGRVESSARDAALLLLEDSGATPAAVLRATGELRAGVELAEACISTGALAGDRLVVGGEAVEAWVSVPACMLSTGSVFDDEVDVGAVCGSRDPGWPAAVGSSAAAAAVLWCDTLAR